MFAGHNRGKKFVPGIGYVYQAERRPVVTRCDFPGCRAPAKTWNLWIGYRCKDHPPEMEPEGEWTDEEKA